MITVRESDARGTMQADWLDAKYSFSFAGYQDPEHMGFGPLRVINEDRIAPNGGFPTHPHQNFEIVSYVVGGALQHKDSMGNTSVIKPGEVQHMSAGSGVRHSEFNPSDDTPTHLLQIWFKADAQNIDPVYNQRAIKEEDRMNTLNLALSQDGHDNSMIINQDVNFYVSVLEDGKSLEHVPAPNRLQWVQVAKGEVRVNGKTLKAGDGAAIQDETRIIFDNAKRAEFLLFDMANV